MPDDRQSGLGGIIRFNGISGTVASLPDKKRSKDQNESEEKESKDQKDQDAVKSEYVDRSAQLSATLNSLALQNVGNVKKAKRKFLEIVDKDKQPKR